MEAGNRRMWASAPTVGADAIVGPVGIVIADAMLGEITPAMALAVGQSAAAASLPEVK